jgi:SAM-dependent methyltransferase
MSGDNDDTIALWNSQLFERYLRFRHIVGPAFGGYSEAAFSARPPKVGARVLDVGCGGGDTTLELARLVGADGEAVGVDAASRFVELASQEAKEKGIGARFVAADAQVDDLGGPYDGIYSRFGVMFFGRPLEAFRNLRRSLRQDGTLCLLTWRRIEDNPVFLLPELAVKSLIDVPEENEDAVAGRGPLSLADADHVSDLLLRAGFSRIAFERRDAPLLMGMDLDEAVEFAMAFGPAGALIRRAGVDGERQKTALVAALRRVLSEFATPQGVLAPSSAWIVTATAERADTA